MRAGCAGPRACPCCPEAPGLQEEEAHVHSPARGPAGGLEERGLPVPPDTRTRYREEEGASEQGGGLWRWRQGPG